MVVPEGFVERAVLPTDEFDPDTELVLRFARRLARARGVGLFRRRSSDRVRIRFTAAAGGRCVMTVSAAEKLERLLRAAMYHQCELLPAREVLRSLFEEHGPNSGSDQSAAAGGWAGAGSGHSAIADEPAVVDALSGSLPAVGLVPPPDPDPEPASEAAEPRFFARAEMVLAKPAYWPLYRVPLDPDPLIPLVSAMADVDPDETLDVVFDLVPVTQAARSRWEKKATASFERAELPSQQTVFDQFRDELARGSRWERDPASRPAREEGRLEKRATSERISAVRSQMGTPDVQFLAQVLVRASSPAKGRPARILETAVAGFDVSAGSYNWWKVRGWRLFGVFWGADSSRRRREGFDYRFDGGRLSRRRLQRVNATAIAGFLKPPTARCDTPNVARSAGIVGAPPAGLPRWRPNTKGLWPLGVVSDRRGEEFVGAARLDDSLFSLCCGSSGSGKTESSLGRILATADAGHSVVFVDPHGTGVERLKGFLALHRDRIYEISLEAGRNRQAGWNPFAIHHRAQIEERMMSVSDALAAAVGWRHGINNRAIGITVNSVRTLLELALAVPADMKPTVFQLGALLGDDDWRDTVVGHLSAQTREYWGRFAYRGSEFSPLTSLVDRLRTSESVAALLGASQPSFDLRQVMDTGGIILVKLRGTGDTDKLVAALMVYMVLEALLSRRDIPEAQRRPCHVWVDEAQIVDDAIRHMTAALAEQSRKFGGRLHLLCQAPERLSKLTYTAMMTNRSHLITSALADKGARIFVEQWAGQISPRTLQRLPNYGFVGQIRLDGSRGNPFRIRSVPIDQLWPQRQNTPEQTEQLNQHIARNSGYQPTADTLATLDALTGRIHDYLQATKSPKKPDDTESFFL